MFQYTLQFIFNKFNQSKIMGHDKITVHLAEQLLFEWQSHMG